MGFLGLGGAFAFGIVWYNIRFWCLSMVDWWGLVFLGSGRFGFVLRGLVLCLLVVLVRLFSGLWFAGMCGFRVVLRMF